MPERIEYDEELHNSLLVPANATTTELTSGDGPTGHGCRARAEVRRV